MTDAGPPPTGGAAVTTFQFDPQRTGANRAETRLTPASVRAGFGRVTAFAPTLDGDTYAQPLYLPSVMVGGASRELLFVATQANTVFALDALTGETVWRQSLGAPVPRSRQPCGNLNSGTGVLGTPVIDPAAGTLYAVSYNSDGGLQFRLHALDVATGMERAGYPAPLAPPMSNGSSFDPAPSQQRGALTLNQGRVYVPFGGLYGDCGLYHGWVVGVDTANPSSQVSFATPGRGSGIWAVGGGSVDEAGAMYVATGNSTPLGGHTPGSLGEFVLRLGLGASGPTFQMGANADYFSPSNARALDLQDLDIGSNGPVVLPAVGSARYLFQAGKAGVAYLLDRANLGGVGGGDGTTGEGAFSARLFAGGVFGAAAAWSDGASTYVFIPGRGSASGCSARGGVMAARVEVSGGAPRLTTAWCSGTISNPNPPAVSSNGNADGIVWVAGVTPTLRAYELSTGTEIFSDAPPSVRQWTPLTVAGGKVYVTGRNTVYLYSLR
ncbi:MAG: PQQ-binding-like beta-propeller repeat protein [Polyangiales bacterium]